MLKLALTLIKSKKMDNLEIFDKDGKVLHIADVMAMLLPDLNEFDNEAEQFADGGFSTDDEKHAYITAWQECRNWLVNYYKSN